jgi:hypothetical protein
VYSVWVTNTLHSKMPTAFQGLVDHHIEDIWLYLYFEITDDSLILCQHLVITLLVYYSDGPGFDPQIRY